MERAPFTIGQRVRVRAQHARCTWCSSVQRRGGVVQDILRYADPWIGVALEGWGYVLMKVECLEPDLS